MKNTDWRAISPYIALVIFSIQFLLPWGTSSWLDFWRSIGFGTIIITVFTAVINKPRPFSVRNGNSDETVQLRDVRWTRDFVLVFIIAGAFALLLYSMQFVLSGNKNLKEALALFGAGSLVALASLMAGAFAGFIFGIPRFLRERQANPEPSKTPSTENSRSATVATTASTTEASVSTEVRSGASRFQSNTNLEEISDWLTKIIVGLGLTQLGNIPDYEASDLICY